MRIFLDTEFTDFKQPQLISIGLATEDERHFYAELNTFDSGSCSDFVKQVVLPQLGKQPHCVMDAERLHVELTNWLTQFARHEPVVCFDYHLDWALLLQALNGQVPAWLRHENVYYQLNDLVQEQFRVESGLSDHHALHDAIANRLAYRAELGRTNFGAWTSRDSSAPVGKEAL